MPPAITASDLGKRYRIGASRAPYGTLREAIIGVVRRGAAARADEIWALRGVGFEVSHGEIVGIIGRNGAGKSTLLKILSRITPPTTGAADLRGRVGSLLEVGTGFHPELTGRENVFLNGAILGMSRRDIARRFDEIVAFAEVEKFLDTPVKRYSSGMYLRLAFAVAAHLEPDILVVDEVLAVGDASFQKKCLDKMEDAGHGGRTVLFVSHNMPAVTRLCPRTILLDNGRVQKDGPSHEVVAAYLGSTHGTMAAREWTDLRTAPGDHVVRLLAVRVRNEKGAIASAVDIRRPLRIELEFQVLEGGHRLVPNLHFLNDQGTYVFVSSDVTSENCDAPKPPGRYVSSAYLPGNYLAEGTLIVGAAISTMDPVVVHVFERDAVAFQVVDSLEGGSARGSYAGPVPGVVRPLLQWQSSVVATENNAAAAGGPR